MADVNGDGRLDLVTGSDDCCDREPGFHWFRREANGRFTAMPEVLVRIDDVPEPWDQPWDRFRMCVTLVDWDGDGRLDVFATHTRARGGLRMARGPWSVQGEAVAANAEVEGSPPTASMLTQPVVVDWDGDGRLDLITADYQATQSPRPSIAYRVWWSRNEGPSVAPRLGPRRELLRLEDGEQPVGLNAADWDGDGWPDLLVATKEKNHTSGQGKFRTRLWVYPRRTGFQQSSDEAPGTHLSQRTR